MKHVIRPVRLVAAFAVLGGALVLLVRVSAPWWVLPAGVIGPDLSFLAAIGAPTVPGLMPARAVRPYNLLHHPAGPITVGVVSLAVGASGALVLALAWGSHLLWDGAVGYGRRAPDGSIIAPGSGDRRMSLPFSSPQIRVSSGGPLDRSSGVRRISMDERFLSVRPEAAKCCRELG